MRLLLVCTRDWNGCATGRKTVLRTILRSLNRNGHIVQAVVLGRSEGGTAQEACHFLGRPGGFAVAANLAQRAVWQGWSLNECLYYSPSLLARLQAIVHDFQPDCVIADMIRTAPYVDQLGLPWILDLDDLLSMRYRTFCENGRYSNILGYYGTSLHPLARRLLSALAGSVLRWEAQRLAHREVFWTRRANVVSLVSEIEAKQLAKTAGVPVQAMPMSIAIPHKVEWPAQSPRKHRAVFMGSMDGQHNLDAIEYFVSAIAPVLANRGRSLSLDVIGLCPPEVARRFRGMPVNFLGYVDDPVQTLAQYQVFLAPIVSGTGIKTKVLEAMAMGMPVISTARGVAGIPVVDRESCYLARDAAGFADCLAEVDQLPERALQIGLNGRSMVQTHFHEDRLAESWEAMVRSAVGGAPGSTTISAALNGQSQATVFSLTPDADSSPSDDRALVR